MLAGFESFFKRLSAKVAFVSNLVALFIESLDLFSKNVFCYKTFVKCFLMRYLFLINDLWNIMSEKAMVTHLDLCRQASTSSL